MNALSRSTAERSGRDHDPATVLACDGRSARIRAIGYEGTARVAFGCVVRPEPGDRVLIETIDGTSWILAVLERTSGMPARLLADRDVIISAANNLTLAASEIAIEAANTVRIGAPSLDLQAASARFLLDDLLQVGRLAVFHVGKFRHLVELFEVLADRVLTRAKDAIRLVEGSDQLRAGDVDHRAAGTLQLQAETALISADSVVRVDAEQIHMG